MEPLTAGLVACGGVIILTLLGVRIAFAAGITGVLGLIAVRGWGPGTGLAGLLAYQEATHYTLSVLPMFILIGYLAFHAGLTQGAFYAARCWFGRLPGGLAVATVFAAQVSARVRRQHRIGGGVRPRVDSGDAAVRVRQAAGGGDGGGRRHARLADPAQRHPGDLRHHRRAVGRRAAAGGLHSRRDLGGQSTRSSSSSGAGSIPSSATPMPAVDLVARRSGRSGQTWGILAVIGIIFGGLYTGWMTPTEVGGAGAFIMFCLALAHGTKWATIWAGDPRDRQAHGDDLHHHLEHPDPRPLPRLHRRAGAECREWIGGLHVPRLAILLMILALYFILGMFLDGIGMLLLTLPVVYPMIVEAGLRPDLVRHHHRQDGRDRPR